jgi:DNA-binding transcriptional LysR family regulator
MDWQLRVDNSPDKAASGGRVRISVGVSFGRKWVLPLLPALEPERQSNAPA